MTRVQIDDLKGFAGAVGFAVRRDGMSVEDAIAKVAEPHLMVPEGYHRDGHTIFIKDIESGEHVYFVVTDDDELWVSTTHRNGSRLTREQFLQAVKDLTAWASEEK